jgi:hypothetical protein
MQIVCRARVCEFNDMTRGAHAIDPNFHAARAGFFPTPVPVRLRSAFGLLGKRLLSESRQWSQRQQRKPRNRREINALSDGTGLAKRLRERCRGAKGKQ